MNDMRKGKPSDMKPCRTLKDEPTTYIMWHYWAEKKSKTHKQVKCRTCNFWHIWKRKATK